MDSSDELRKYVENRLGKMQRYLEEPIEVNVVLSVEKFRNRAELTIASKGLRLKGQEEKDEMHAAIDLLMDNIQEQIRRSQERKKKRKIGAAVRPTNVYMDVFSAATEEEEAGPRIVRREVLAAKPMYVAEAVAQMRMSSDDFLVFTNAESELVNVLYRRKDGDLGLVASE